MQMSQKTKPAPLPVWFLNAEGRAAVQARAKRLRTTLEARRQVRKLVQQWGAR